MPARVTAHVVFLTVAGLVLTLFCVLTFRANFLFGKPIQVQECASNETNYFPQNLQHEILERFRNSIRCATVSYDRHVGNTSELLKLKELIVESFPAIHSSPLVTVEIVGNFSLLYSIAGKNNTSQPFLLTAHLDVVPVNEEKWTVPPFEGVVKDGYIYGRGTIDDKHSVMGIMEALEFLLIEGYKPERPFYIAFGHDEEVNGLDGAQKITQLLHDRGVHFDFVLDEGLFVLDGVLPGVSSPVAMIGVTEKGYLTVELSVQGTAGHSSIPPRETSIGILSRALYRLQYHPHKNMFGYGPEKALFEALVPYANSLFSLVYANLWLFSYPVSWVLSTKPSQNAMVRTTTAITVINGGHKENVIPATASALVNHRIHPAQTVEEVLEYDRLLIADERVQLRVVHGDNPQPISEFDDKAGSYWAIHKSIRQVFHKAVVAPGVLVANTDSRWYGKLASNVYRFTPAYLFAGDLNRFHGDDERISVENYWQVIDFYIHLIKNCNEGIQNDVSHDEL